MRRSAGNPQTAAGVSLILRPFRSPDMGALGSGPIDRRIDYDAKFMRWNLPPRLPQQPWTNLRRRASRVAIHSRVADYGAAAAVLGRSPSLCQKNHRPAAEVTTSIPSHLQKAFVVHIRAGRCAPRRAPNDAAYPR